MDLNDFVGLKDFKIEDFQKETPIKRSLTLNDFLKIPVNKEYQETKDKLKLDLDSNFKSNTNIVNESQR